MSPFGVRDSGAERLLLTERSEPGLLRWVPDRLPSYGLECTSGFIITAVRQKPLPRGRCRVKHISILVFHRGGRHAGRPFLGHEVWKGSALDCELESSHALNYPVIIWLDQIIHMVTSHPIWWWRLFDFCTKFKTSQKLASAFGCTLTNPATQCRVRAV